MSPTPLSASGISAVCFVLGAVGPALGIATCTCINKTPMSAARTLMYSANAFLRCFQCGGQKHGSLRVLISVMSHRLTFLARLWVDTITLNPKPYLLPNTTLKPPWGARGHHQGSFISTWAARKFHPQVLFPASTRLFCRPKSHKLSTALNLPSSPNPANSVGR